MPKNGKYWKKVLSYSALLNFHAVGLPFLPEGISLKILLLVKLTETIKNQLWTKAMDLGKKSTTWK